MHVSCGTVVGGDTRQRMQSVMLPAGVPPSQIEMKMERSCTGLAGLMHELWHSLHHMVPVSIKALPSRTRSQVLAGQLDVVAGVRPDHQRPVLDGRQLRVKEHAGPRCTTVSSAITGRTGRTALFEHDRECA